MKWDIKGFHSIVCVAIFRFFSLLHFLCIVLETLAGWLAGCLWCRLISLSYLFCFSILSFFFAFKLPFRPFEILNVRSNSLRSDRRLPLCVPQRYRIECSVRDNLLAERKCCIELHWHRFIQGSKNRKKRFIHSVCCQTNNWVRSWNAHSIDSAFESVWAFFECEHTKWIEKKSSDKPALNNCTFYLLFYFRWNVSNDTKSIFYYYINFFSSSSLYLSFFLLLKIFYNLLEFKAKNSTHHLDAVEEYNWMR